MRRVISAAALAIAVLATVCACAGQETESAVMTPRASVAPQPVRPPSYLPAGPERNPARDTAELRSSEFMTARKGPPPDEVNRKELEDNAGPDGARLLLRSVPSGADIFINGRLVGQTPMLLVVAPGNYKIDMRGSRQEFGTKTVGLLAKDTQNVVISLNQRYPSQIHVF
ncbi:MAG TPA: PEGA domain-containing protein [Candidatus Acidoferrum sp.]|nr:PEGA domain-containing protein [Candidatus Acidoferrum sp.]